MVIDDDNGNGICGYGKPHKGITIYLEIEMRRAIVQLMMFEDDNDCARGFILTDLF